MIGIKGRDERNRAREKEEGGSYYFFKMALVRHKKVSLFRFPGSHISSHINRRSLLFSASRTSEAHFDVTSPSSQSNVQ